mmetsp:Transcript_1096/g.4695  ORF Transcript_1096/g.4695 Transcript_1096/m.4695 type:complete len:203 (+) Transcript_1096:1004-1612(+)
MGPGAEVFHGGARRVPEVRRRRQTRAVVQRRDPVSVATVSGRRDGGRVRRARVRREPVRVRHRRGHEGDEHVQGRRRRKGDSAAGGDGGDDRRSQPLFRSQGTPLRSVDGNGTIGARVGRVRVRVVRQRSYAGSVGGFRGGSGSEWRGRGFTQARRDSGTRNPLRPGPGRDEHRDGGAVAQGGRHGGVDARAPGVEAGSRGG